MDLVVLVIPAAILLFLVRTLMIARSLKAHHDRLDEALAEPGNHLAAAKRLATVPKRRTSTRSSRAPAGDLLVERRS